MKQTLDAAQLELMEKDAENRGYAPMTDDMLASKGIFGQNLLLKNDVVEFPPFDIRNYRQGKEFETTNKDGEKVKVRGTVTYIRINGVWRFFPLGTFRRGSQVANREDLVEACRDKYELNLRILTCQDEADLARLLSGKRFKVAENQQFKFQRFDKDHKRVEGEFDLKSVSLFEELAD